MSNGTPREVAFLICLSEAYELAGRKVADSTIMSAAREMAARIPCSDSEIKELFLSAREISDIPTIKTLWKAWSAVCEKRMPQPSSTIEYDAIGNLMRRINYNETLKMFAFKIGKYSDLCHAYSTKRAHDGKNEFIYPSLKHQFDSEVIPFMEKVCGKWLGMNPNDPEHPINKFVYKYRVVNRA